MTMTDRPALLAIWVSLSRKRAVGIPETARRKSLPGSGWRSNAASR
jgi:hypothetical protein